MAVGFEETARLLSRVHWQWSLHHAVSQPAAANIQQPKPPKWVLTNRHGGCTFICTPDVDGSNPEDDWRGRRRRGSRASAGLVGVLLWSKILVHWPSKRLGDLKASNAVARVGAAASDQCDMS